MPTANEAVPADPSCFYVKDKHRCPSPLKNVKLLCIPFLLTTLYVENFLLYVVKSNYFVVHYLMLPQTLINSVYGFSTHSVISRTVAALGGGGSPPWQCPAVPQIPPFASLVSHCPTAPQPGVGRSHFPSALWRKRSFQGPALQPGIPPALISEPPAISPPPTPSRLGSSWGSWGGDVFALRSLRAKGLRLLLCRSTWGPCSQTASDHAHLRVPGRVGRG